MMESNNNNQLNLLARRIGYNMALRHFRIVQEVAASVGDGYNLADLLNNIIDEGRIMDYQILPIVNMLLVDKYKYAAKSINLGKSITSADRLRKIMMTWTNIQAVLLYYSNDGLKILNPESTEIWESTLPLSQGAFLVCYACTMDNSDNGLADKAVSDILKILQGGQVRSTSAYQTSGNLKQLTEKKTDTAPSRIETTETVPKLTTTKTEESVKPVPQEKPSSGVKSTKLTAKISVDVTNELFHNGNVEAWKRIIQSYKVKYPQLDILVWYDGEKINDLNSLFKWGKVKHGTPIMFSVAGENPIALSKLRKYLFEGASSRFEAFLHGSPGSVLALF